MRVIFIFLVVFTTNSLFAQVVNEDNGNWEAYADPAGTFWEWGTPAGTQINDDYEGGGNAWVTELDGDFSVTGFEQILLTSQAYDLSGISTGNISLAINYDLFSFYDAEFDEQIDDLMTLMYSTDSTNWSLLGTATSGTNWYGINEFGEEGWVGASSGWVLASHELPAEILGASSVYFRFEMYTNVESGTYGSEGFAIDNFRISDASIASDILTMSIPEEILSASIDNTNKTVKLYVAPGADVTSLAPTFTLSAGASSDKISGSTHDFTSPVTYTITAEDPAFSSNWTVSAEVPELSVSLFPESGIIGTEVWITGKGFSSTISENTVTFGTVEATVSEASENLLKVTVPVGADLGSTTVDVTSNGISSDATINFTVLTDEVIGEFQDFKVEGFNLNITVTNSMEVADVDNDGDLDLIYDDGSSLKIGTIEDGLIVSTVTVSTDRSGSTLVIQDIVAKDFNGDGFIDVAAGGTRLGWFQNNGNGTWSDETVISTAGSDFELQSFDIDEDLDFDLAANAGSEVSFFINSGAGVFAVSAGASASSVGKPFDWDADGDMDMISAGVDTMTFSQAVLLLLNDGSGNFTDSVLASTTFDTIDKIVFGDLDNDGDQDFVYSANDGFSASEIGYILNNGDGTFASPSTIRADVQGVFFSKQIALGDLNGDGFLDISRTKDEGFNDGYFDIYITSGSLSYSYEQLDGSIGGFDIELIDIDFDGDLDILQESSRSSGYFPLYKRASGGNQILSFSFSEETAAATIDSASSTVEIEVNASADISSLIPTIGLSTGATVSPLSGVSQDFSNDVTYTVTSEDGNTQNWTITVYQVPNAPILSATNIEQTTVRISWSELTSADSYELELSTSEDFTSLVSSYDPFTVASGATSSVTVDIENLEIGTNYFARVRAQNSINSYSEYSDTLSILTKPNDPVLSDVDVQNIGQDTILLSWDAVAGEVSGYNVEVSTSETFATLLDDYPLEISDTILVIGSDAGTTLLSPNTTYWIRVQATNATGSSGYSNEISVLTKPETPVLNEITNDLVNQTDATVSWNSVFTTGGSYNVEVSSTDFSTGGTILTGYPISVTGTSTDVGTDVNTASLETATNYWVRIRASNASGESDNSNVVEFLTRPATPVALPASDISTLSFTANWNSVDGSEGYVLEVLNSNDSLISMDSTALTALSIANLIQGTQYKYTVYAYNGTGETQPSNEISVRTNIPPQEIIFTGSSVSENQPEGTVFGNLSTDDEDDPTGPHTYELVSGEGDTDNDQFTIDGNTLVTNAVFDFESKASYDIRIQSTDPKGASVAAPFSVTISDANDAPTGIALATTGFNLTGYDSTGTEVGVFSTTDLDAGDTNANIILELLEGADEFSIVRNPNTGDSTLLVNAIVFKNEVDSSVSITVRATDEDGASVEAQITIDIQKFVDTQAPDFDENVINPTTFLVGGDFDKLALKAEVSDFRLEEVKLFTRLLTEAEFTSKLLTGENGVYVDSIGEQDLGVAGIEYYFEAVDQAGNRSIFGPKTLALAFPESGENAPKVESVTKFGRTVDSYQIISIPFSFANPIDKRVDAIFNEFSGDEINREYRIIKWDPTSGELGELVNLDDASTIELGEGYFFISANERSITIERANINLQDPFPLELKQGWNLIGNPYTIDINWSSVLTDPSNSGASNVVGALRVLDTENPEVWPESNVLKTLEGAFVFSQEDITLNLSYTHASISFGGGRLDTGKPTPDWFLPITLHQNENVRKGGVGMDLNADMSFDQYDEPVLPRWLKYLEISFLHQEERFGRYNRDVVPFAETNIWDFEVSSSEEGLATLHWGVQNEVNLQLYNVETGEVIDMTKQSSYQFDLKSKVRFKLLYSEDPNADFEYNRVVMLDAYPNPFETSFKVPLVLPVVDHEYEITVKLIDASGKYVYKGDVTHTTGGTFEYLMDVQTDLNPGIYLYQVEILNQNNQRSYTKRIQVK